MDDSHQPRYLHWFDLAAALLGGLVLLVLVGLLVQRVFFPQALPTPQPPGGDPAQTIATTTPAATSRVRPTLLSQPWPQNSPR